MALFPCAIGQHRYTGPQSSAYFGITSGIDTERWKQRLCKPHLSRLLNWAGENLTLVGIGEVSQAEENAFQASCWRCNASVNTWSVFLTLYERGEEPRSYFAASCTGHLAEFTQEASGGPAQAA